MNHIKLQQDIIKLDARQHHTIRAQRMSADEVAFTPDGYSAYIIRRPSDCLLNVDAFRSFDFAKMFLEASAARPSIRQASHAT